MNMKRFLIALLSLVTLMPVFAGKKADKETMQWRYEVQDLGLVAKDGKSVIFKIWSYGKKENKALMQATKNAVHAVMFKQIGYNPSLLGTKALTEEEEEFLKLFFADGGEYMRFVQLANNGAVAPTDKIKLKKEYKIGIKVTVNRADLRKYLEERGLVQSMNSIF